MALPIMFQHLSKYRTKWATVNQHTHQCTIHWMAIITHLWMKSQLS
jgi:hypothetical protein